MMGSSLAWVAPLLVGGDLPHFDRVHVVFAEEHRQSLVSGFGHLFVVLMDGEVDSVDELLAGWSLNFGADTSPLGGGIWEGRYRLDFAHALIRQYTKFEMRGLTAIELEIGEGQLRQLKEDLKGRLKSEYPYDFIRHNCGHYLLDWLNGAQIDTPPLLYQTPLESLARILEEYPVRAVRYRASALEVLEGVVDQPAGVEKLAVRRILAGEDRISSLARPFLRLLTLSVLETSAAPGIVEGAKSEVAELFSDPQVASDVLDARAAANASGKEAYKARITAGEGPAVSAFSVYSEGSGSSTARVLLEMGLRDYQTQPRSRRSCRKVKFLALELGSWESEEKAAVDWISVDTIRPIDALIPLASSGFSLASESFEDPLGRRGLSLSTWAGVSARIGQSWLGARATLLADQVLEDPRLEAAPGLFWVLPTSTLSVATRVDYSHGRGLGAEVQTMLTTTEGTHLVVRSTVDPERGAFIGLGAALRF